MAVDGNIVWNVLLSGILLALALSTLRIRKLIEGEINESVKSFVCLKVTEYIHG